MQFLDYVDHMYMHPLVVDVRRRDYFYASNASLKVENMWGERETIGACLRAQWYRLKGEPKGCGESPEGLRRMDYGSVIHEYECERFKKANVFVAAEVSYFDPVRNVSGRVDAFVFNPLSQTQPKEMFGVEIKTVGGYKGVKDTITSHNREPRPAHVLQTMVNADFYKEKVNTWLLLYYDREGGRSAQHTVVLTKDGVSINGVAKPWSLQAIYERWSLLKGLIEADELPPRDYEMQYSPDRIKLMMERQQLSKSELAEVKKGRMVDKGDFACKVCPWRTICYA